MPDQEASLLERLCKVRNPRELHDWKGRDGYYVAACRVSGEDVPALIDIAGKWGDWDWLEAEVEPDVDQELTDLLPITAWRTLADLKAEAAVEPLIDMLRAWDDEYDWPTEELPHVFGKIGEPAILPLIHLANDAGEEDIVRSIAVRGLGCVAKYHPHARDRVVACLTQMMADAFDDDVYVNSSVLVELVDLRAVEAAEPIERAFAADALDVGMMGDWEDVRRELGVKSLGLEMPESPHNSMEDFRIRAGIGIFSKEAVFGFGEVNEKAEQAYYQQAWDTFSKSSEAQRVVDRHGDLGWIRSCLAFGVNCLGETVDAMTLASVREFVLDYAPRKVSTGADSAAAIVFELAMFWEYLDRVYDVPEAKAIIEWLHSPGLVAELKEEMSDSSNFGMAKSFVMMGNEAGYDMTTQEGLNAFMMVYNQSLLASQPPRAEPPRRAEQPPMSKPIPAAREQRVGRNDPCPCGSGKKFKKCCR